MYKNNFVVAVKNNGKILREHNSDTIYLPFNSEYSILIKNKDTRKAVVSIEVDGVNAFSGNSLVVDGNTSQEVLGFMRDMTETNRFRFIRKTKEIRDYRGDRIDDGLIRVSYQFERHCFNILPLVSCNKKFLHDDIGYYTGNDYNTCSFTSSCSCDNTYKNDGITVKGSKVTQRYNYGLVGALEDEIYTIVLQLKGKTTSKKYINMPITVKTKIKCETCGRKNKSTNTFCYNCGTYLK